MQIGIASAIGDAQTIAGVGFDYLETHLYPIMEMSDENFRETAGKVKDSGISCMALHMFFRPGPFEPGPACMQIVGPAVDRKKLADYAKKAGDRAAELGVRYIGFGNGACRRKPDDWSFEDARDSLISSLHLIGEELADRNISLVLEPVRREESNLINTIVEGAEVVRHVDLPNVKLLADFWQMRMVDEKMTDILEVGDMLTHTHIAGTKERTFPLDSKDDIYEEFFYGLEQIGYTGAMSIEAELTADYTFSKERARQALSYLKKTALKFGL